MAPEPLHALVAGFADVAAVYDRARPEYPPAAVERIVAELEAEPGARVLDLGAGTGKLTRPLLAAGLDVVAVEPLARMRAALAAAVGSRRALDGRAEAIPLGDASVDAARASSRAAARRRSSATAASRRCAVPRCRSRTRSPATRRWPGSPRSAWWARWRTRSGPPCSSAWRRSSIVTA